jgi:hypothetical protein
MNRWMALLLWLCLASTHRAFAEESATGNILSQNHDDTIRLVNLDEYTRDYFVKSLGRKNPGWVIADLDGDSSNDIALLKRDVAQNTLTLHIYICKPKCQEVGNVALGHFNGDQFLAPVKPGQLIHWTEALPLPHSSQVSELRLNHFAVEYVVFGKASIVFFWDPKQKQINKVATGD